MQKVVKEKAEGAYPLNNIRRACFNVFIEGMLP